MPKLSRQARFLKLHPLCCFCGGTRAATTVDHVPPKACFPVGHWPEEFEFPACAACNNGTSKYDTIFGYFSILSDFNEENRTPGDRRRLASLENLIALRYPDALPDPVTAQPIFRSGVLYTPSPVAYSVSATAAVKEAVAVINQKLAHALYYQRTGRILTDKHRFACAAFQLQQSGTEGLTAFFKRLLPDLKIGKRENVKRYGNRFGYLSGHKAEADLFLYAAQFGYGLILWGMSMGPTMTIEPNHEGLRKLTWRAGGNGLGAHISTMVQP